MPQFKCTLLLQLCIYVVYVQTYPLSPDQRFSLFQSKWYKKPFRTTGLFQDIGQHRFDTLTPRPKKDVFVSRSWSAGGMPFSVLYMNPKHPKNTRSPPEEQRKVLSYDDEYQLPERVQAQALTGGGVSPLPSRRQYSIIPQLFVSYGWGPLGK